MPNTVQGSYLFCFFCFFNGSIIEIHENITLLQLSKLGVYGIKKNLITIYRPKVYYLATFFFMLHFWLTRMHSRENFPPKCNATDLDRNKLDNTCRSLWVLKYIGIKWNTFYMFRVLFFIVNTKLQCGC